MTAKRTLAIIGGCVCSIYAGLIIVSALEAGGFLGAFLIMLFHFAMSGMERGWEAMSNECEGCMRHRPGCVFEGEYKGEGV